MKPALWLLLGIVIGGSAGWYGRGLTEQDARASTNFNFNDKLADRQYPYLSASGSWRGGDLANKVNAVRIVCDAAEKNCDLQQADVMSLSGGPLLSMYSKSFRITKVDDQSVVAEALPDVCIRQTLTFDRAAKAVTMVRTKINREDACSIVQDAPLSLYLGEPLR
ncbi:hypothetical protein [Bradyrhizobium sp. th.b2]|uniref:hypothetical protein n=1 Tax=Bradyrhizobium sp. th-b2 TaxID=172088 RepID=UPI0003F52F70|nr:hypothetical protein [Bradyrhizobium sp. th.b2]